ncbi:AAA family ATPase [Paracoccus yeei]
MHAAAPQYALDDESLDLLGTDPIPFPSDNRAVALDLAARGLAVFPIRDWGDGDGWKPIGAFPEKASSDRGQVSAWWRKWPDARVGLLTGARNGITVLDVDAKNGKDGTETLADLGFPDLSSVSPCRVRTPSGGWHLVLDYDSDIKNSVSKIGSGLDFKNDRGFIVAPGSFKDGARYVPEGETLRRDSRLPPIPAALKSRAPQHEPFEDLLGRSSVPLVVASHQQREWAQERLTELAENVAAAPEGQRHDTLNSVALLCGGYGAHGALTQGEAKAALIPAALACGLSEREARRTFESAWADGLKKPVDLPGDCEDWFSDEGPKDEKNESASQSKKSKAFTFEWFHEAELPESSPFLIEGLLDQGTASVVYGPSNAGKTFFTLDLCHALANAGCGATWQGRAIERTAVLYMALEGGSKFTLRLKALQRAFGDGGKIPFAYRRGGANLLHKDDKGDVKAIINMAKAMQSDAVAAGLPLLIVIDTLSRALSGGDENAPTDMTAFVGNVDRIREATEAHVMVVHHTGKDIAKGMRGHSSLVAAIDSEIEVIRPDAGSVVQVTVGKQRDHKSDYPFGNFQIKEVALGVDVHGKELSSAVADWGVSQERVAPIELTKKQERVVEIFRTTNGGQAVEREALIAACLNEDVSEAKDPKDRRKGVTSILGALVNKNALALKDGSYRIYSPGDDLGFDDLGDEPSGGTGEHGGTRGECSPAGMASAGGRNGTRPIGRSLFPYDAAELDDDLL